MINRNFSDKEQLIKWSREFHTGHPFRFLVIDNFSDYDFAECLSREFPALNNMDVTYKGINEQKSEHSNFAQLHSSFTDLKSQITNPQFINIIEKISGISSLETIDDRYGCGLHQGGANSFLDIHVDYNLHPVKKKQRRLNLIIFLNPEWREEWGGNLEFWNKDVTQCMHSISPIFNRCVLFECTDHSYHGYSKIKCPASTTRKSFYQYYFSEPEQKLFFHDTIFKNKPQEPIIKKFVVAIKETAKNWVKRIFYYLGLTNFLK